MGIILFLLISNNVAFEHLPSPFIAEEFMDVKRVDSLLYFVTERGLEIFSWHSGNPQRISRYATEGWAEGVYVVGDYAYIADHYNGLCIVSVSDPATPALIGNCDTPGKALDVVVSNTYAYLADQENGLVIVDVSNPSVPYLAGQCSGIGHTYAVTLADTLVYTGVCNSALKIIDVSDPAYPHVVGQFPPGEFVYGIDACIDDTLAYINCGFWSGAIIHFAVVNVKEPTNPLYVAGLAIPATNRGLEKVGNSIYTNTQDHGIHIIDVTEPTAPFVTGCYDETRWFGVGFMADDTLLLATHFLEGFSIADIRDRQKPVTLYKHENIVWETMAFDDDHDYSYFSGNIEENDQFWHSVLKIADVSDPSIPVVCGELYSTGRCYLYRGSADYPYIVYTIQRHDSSFIAVTDVSDPYTPELTRFVEGNGVLELCSTYLYCLDGRKLKIADIDHPSFWVDSLVIPADGYDICIMDTLAYVTVRDSLLILSLLSGNQLGYCYHGRPRAIRISTDFPYLAVPYTPFPGSSFGFLLFDVSNPVSPSLLFDTLIYEEPIDSIALYTVACEIKDTLLFFCRTGYGFDIWNISNPDSIYRIANQETPYCALSVHLKDDVVFVEDMRSIELYRAIGLGIEESSFTETRMKESSFEAMPNPFMAETKIKYCLLERAYELEDRCVSVELKIYDVSGRVVRDFLLPVSSLQLSVSVTWDGTDDCGNRLPQGVYFIKLETERGACREKVVLLR